MLQLFSGLATDGVDVVVLNTSPTSCFVGDIPTSEMPTPFLRCLLTDHCFPVPDCSRSLEQPNLISGLAAQSDCTFMFVGICIDSLFLSVSYDACMYR